MRNAQKALLIALLEPSAMLRGAEESGDYTTRLWLLEQAKTLPWSSVWDEYCQRNGTPNESECLAAIKAYEQNVLALRA